jgi:hypothetical protein
VLAAAIEREGTTFRDYQMVNGESGRNADFLVAYGQGGRRAPVRHARCARRWWRSAARPTARGASAPHRWEREVRQHQAHEYLGSDARIDVAPDLPGLLAGSDLPGEPGQPGVDEGAAAGGHPFEQQCRILVPTAGQHGVLREEADADDERLLESSQDGRGILDAALQTPLESFALADEQGVDQGVLVGEVAVQGRLARPGPAGHVLHGGPAQAGIDKARRGRSQQVLPAVAAAVGGAHLEVS